MSIKNKALATTIVFFSLFSLIFFISLCMNNKETLSSVVETTYEQAVKGEDIPCEQTWKIEKLYNDGVKKLSESEWDEIDRKINVIADSCKFDSSNPDSPTPFRPAVKELRNSKPAGPWAGPTD